MSVANKNLRNAFFFCSLGALVAACGGGGGGGAVGSSPTDTTTTGIEGSNVSEPVANGDKHAILSWDAPTTNTDGSCLEGLAGYRVSYGLSPGVYDQQVDIPVEEMSGAATGRSTACGDITGYTFMVENLPTASWYFVVQAFDTEGNISDYSNEAVKTVQ